MSALTSNHYGTRAATHREYRLLFGLTFPLFVGGVLLRRLGLMPDRVPAGPLSSISFMATVRRRVGAVLPFAFMG